MKIKADKPTLQACIHVCKARHSIHFEDLLVKQTVNEALHALEKTCTGKLHQKTATINVTGQQVLSLVIIAGQKIHPNLEPLCMLVRTWIVEPCIKVISEQNKPNP